MADASPESTGQTLWHGRFASGPAAALMAFTESLSFDRRMAAHDVIGCKAHARGLHRIGLLDADELDELLRGLDQVGDELAGGSFAFADGDEDIHTAIERRVTDLTPVGAKLHTGRSRNDQVATAFRLWVRDAVVSVASAVVDLQAVLVARAQSVGDAYLPGYTHLQRAQPVPLGHHLAAHAWTFSRDVDRLVSAWRRADVSPLGAGALAGSSLPLDPAATASDLGFGSVFDNSLDVTADRDFVAEALFALAMVGVHLSRIGEEFVLWSSAEFGFVTLDDTFATGSSMMPQKKNADIAELTRGKSGRLIGNLTGLLATLKGLPLAYNRDLQEDKEALFDSVDQVGLALVAVAGMIETATFNTDTMAAAADDETALATDLAEILVAKGTPFRRAHAIVGALVQDHLSSGRALSALVDDSDDFGDEVGELFKPGAALGRRTTAGGAGLEPLRAQLQVLTERLASDRARVADLPVSVPA